MAHSFAEFGCCSVELPFLGCRRMWSCRTAHCRRRARKMKALNPLSDRPRFCLLCAPVWASSSSSDCCDEAKGDKLAGPKFDHVRETTLTNCAFFDGVEKAAPKNLSFLRVLRKFFLKRSILLQLLSNNLLRPHHHQPLYPHEQLHSSCA